MAENINLYVHGMAYHTCLHLKQPSNSPQMFPVLGGAVLVEESMVLVVLVPNIRAVIHRDKRAYPDHCSGSNMGPDVERPASTLSLWQYGSCSSSQRSHCLRQSADASTVLRCLHFIEAAYCFVLVASHVPGKQNELADDLSCNRLSIFLQKATWANPQPSHIPQPFLSALMDPRRDWTSETWTNLFRDTATGR